MKMEKQYRGEELTIVLEGRLDTKTAPELEAELKMEMDGAKSLVFDMDKVTYISSAGLRVLLVAYKAMSSRGGIRVIHVHKALMDVLEVTGFTEILNIEED